MVVIDGAVEKALDWVNCVVLAQEEFIGEVDEAVKDESDEVKELVVKASEADVILSVLDLIVV